MEISVKQLKVLLSTLTEAGVGEFSYGDDKYKLRIVLQPTGMAPVAHRPRVDVIPAEPARAPLAVELGSPNEPEADVFFVTSPFVGTFYRAASPEADPFVTEGTPVKPGQALCIIEAMKLMNEIEVEEAGTIEEIFVENGKSVEFGQRLFKLRKG